MAAAATVVKGLKKKLESRKFSEVTGRDRSHLVGSNFTGPTTISA
jgi:hypothetical protein